MVDMVNPQLGEKILDPATGTGGFLVCAIEHLRKQVHITAQDNMLQNSITGVEKKQLAFLIFRASHTLVRLGTRSKAYTTVDHLSGGQIATSVIALPPLAKQSRIVTRVASLRRLCPACAPTCASARQPAHPSPSGRGGGQQRRLRFASLLAGLGTLCWAAVRHTPACS